MNGTGRTWLWVVLAFVLGLAIGLGAFVWQYSSTQRTIATAKRQLESDNASLTAEVQRLSSEARTAEASAAALIARSGGTGPVPSTTTSGNQNTSVATGPVKIVGRTVTPATAPAGKQNALTLTIKVQGAAAKARMRIVSASSPNAYDKIWDLAQGATDNGVTTWTRVINAPTVKGVYHYYALAYVGTTKYTMPGVTGFTFNVQ